MIRFLSFSSNPNALSTLSIIASQLWLLWLLIPFLHVIIGGDHMPGLSKCLSIQQTWIILLKWTTVITLSLFPSELLGFKPLKTSESEFPNRSRGSNYILEPDQWLALILTLILHCLIQWPGLNQEMRCMATFYSTTLSIMLMLSFHYVLINGWVCNWTADRRSRYPSGLQTSKISSLNPFSPLKWSPVD